MADTTFHPGPEPVPYINGYPEVALPPGLIEAVANRWQVPTPYEAFLIDTYASQLRRRAVEGDPLATSMLRNNLELQDALDAIAAHFTEVPF